MKEHYNKEQVENNFRVFKKCVEDCLDKLVKPENDKIKNLLELKLREVFLIVDFTMECLSDVQKDEYLKKVFSEVENYKKLWEVHKSQREYIST